MFSDRLMLVELPTWPYNAGMISGRSAWLSIFSGSASASANTLPVESITVTRAPAAFAACMVMSRRDAGGEFSTREANISAFWRSDVSTWSRSMPSHERPMSTFRVRVQAAMMSSAAKNNFRKMRLLNVGSLRFRHLEAVACSADRLQITRLVRVRFDLLTNAPYVNIHRARRHIMGVAPNRVQQLVAGEDSSRMPRQIFQQPELGGCRLLNLATHHQGHTATVNLDVAGLHNCRRQRTLEAAQHRAHPRHQLARAERLGDIVVRAQFQSDDAVRLAHLRSQKYDRSHIERGRLANAPAKLQAVASGDHDVQKEQRRRLLLRFGNYAGGRCEGANGITGALQMMTNQP